MKDTAPISEGIIAVAALFAIIATGVAFVLYDFSFFAAACIGGGVGLVAAIVLALGWREPAPGPQGVATREVAPAPTSVPDPVAVPEPAAAEPAPAVATPAPAAPVTAAAEKPEFMSEAREGGPDDLKQIKGVGPKLENTLHGMGVYHFDQIASWGPAEVAWMDDNLEGFKGRVSRDNWIDQAKVLAGGGETAFSKKVEDGDVY
ncbi:NADH:ubiquinone oxidoreductase [Yoonia litorea]|uniref:Predicted 5' DNA nuclease, flap endonuclease-1-like, helix-3-turn-helix (H3TH) domain n=1 Tax=Yoonia litorea TaxID=1123755 RepID=A0A1I6LTE8_9RHOB|nr:NADH:ubiquinone oxidoreductase [Yoonia litorea]SFS06709.1 Predicted 5' DNA nuclease, flap endonuclease-1-like, helix-3-turn-helix (H3TH) domain [Yoonia litorea]